MDSDAIYDRYYNLSLRYLSYRPRSEKELFDYLKKKTSNNSSLTEEIINKILGKLKEYKFIDDSAFAKFWVEQRTKFKRKPIRVIEYELKQKGIEKSLVDEILFLFDKKELDLENAKRLAEKKLDFYRNLPTEKRREKVINYLLRKGFSFDIVAKALRD